MSYPPPPAGQSPYPSAPPPGSGYGAPPGLRGRTPRRLGWIFLGLAVVAFVVGGIVIGTKSLGKVNSFARVSFASGGATVTLNGTGKWVGYYEASDVTTSIQRIPQFEVAVTSPSGTNVALQDYGNLGNGSVRKFTYEFNGHKGAAAFQFTADEKGAYTIKLQPIATLPSGADVAIGRDIAGGTAAGGLVIVLGVLLLITAIVLLIVGFVKRSRHKKELASGNYGFGGQPYAYPQQPPAAYDQPQPPQYPQPPPPPPPGWQPPPG